MHMYRVWICGFICEYVKAWGRVWRACFVKAIGGKWQTCSPLDPDTSVDSYNKCFLLFTHQNWDFNMGMPFHLSLTLSLGLAMNFNNIFCGQRMLVESCAMSSQVTLHVISSWVPWSFHAVTILTPMKMTGHIFCNVPDSGTAKHLQLDRDPASLRLLPGSHHVLPVALGLQFAAILMVLMLTPNRSSAFQVSPWFLHSSLLCN